MFSESLVVLAKQANIPPYFSFQHVSLCTHQSCMFGSVGALPITPRGRMKGAMVAGGWELLTWPPGSKRSRRRCSEKGNTAAFIPATAEPGKSLRPPLAHITACGSRQGGKWTYRCCSAPLPLCNMPNLWSEEEKSTISHTFQWELSADRKQSPEWCEKVQDIHENTVKVVWIFTERRT